jgi:tRNA nucleotidyltransferase/poly(A) polymerase
MIKIYEVGGSIRDSFLGKENKDLDYSVEAPSFEDMLKHIKDTHKKVFLVKPEYLTVRAQGMDGLARDYVMCRKDGSYSDQRRPDSVEIGTIYDDLARRDFTVNAIARDVQTGVLIDPHGGVADLKKGLLRAVGSARERFNEDPLRLIRAVRFSITKGLELDAEIAIFLMSASSADKLKTISEERIREELYKCFNFSTSKTIRFLNECCSQRMIDVLFDDTGIWLKPTTERK